LGLPLVFFVSSAKAHDGIAGIELFPQLYANSKWMKLLRNNGIYRRYFEECAYTIERTKKFNNGTNFVLQTGHWQVERASVCSISSTD